MGIELRRGAPDDSVTCGRICFEAFKSLAERHGFPPDFPSPEIASGLLSMLVRHPGFYGVVAMADGEIAGSNFMDQRSQIVGIGPISVDPATQKRGVGRLLMEHVLDRAAERRAPGVRLVQAGYNNQTLCLYTKLGFRAREPLSIMSGHRVPNVVAPNSAFCVEGCERQYCGGASTWPPSSAAACQPQRGS
jgi:GNAT superfamily N-acetyltransferase